MKKTVNQVNEESAILSGGIFETINSLEEIKILDYRRKQMRMIYNLAYSVKQSVLNMNKSLNLYFENFSFMSAIIGTGILYLSGLLIIDQALSVGGYIAFTGYLARILGNIQVYSTAGITIQPILVSIQRIQEFLSFGDEKEGRDQSLTGRIDSIKFVNVTFKYEGQNEILQNFNYRVSKGDKVLIVGTNGSGKTTLIKLLLSLYNPTYGQIMFNDVDLSKIKLDEIRQRISVVSQNIHLFKGTIIDNIILEKDCSRLQYLDKVIKDYKLTSLFNLESKLNNEVENGGSNLSGGQKQLIAFLRAVVSQKEILILDEPTSALDAAAKERIINILKNECMSIIVIIISHDPSFSFIENKIHMSKISESSFAT
jgi:ATP-binding cassette subfamily C protein